MGRIHESGMALGSRWNSLEQNNRNANKKAVPDQKFVRSSNSQVLVLGDLAQSQLGNGESGPGSMLFSEKDFDGSVDRELIYSTTSNRDL